MTVKYYEGGRIYFRPIEQSDEPLLRRWVNDPANWRTLLRFLPVNEAREKEWIDKLYVSPEAVTLGIVVKRSERLIGACGFHRIDPVHRHGLYGILIGETSFQGRGFGTEATKLMVRYGFTELNLNRIQLTAHAGNERALRAYRRAGFVEEGRARQVYFRNGCYHDEVCMGLLREEWQESRGDVAAEEEDDSGDGPAVTMLSSMTLSDGRLRA